MTQKNLIIHDLNEKEWDRIKVWLIPVLLHGIYRRRHVKRESHTQGAAYRHVNKGKAACGSIFLNFGLRTLQFGKEGRGGQVLLFHF